MMNKSKLISIFSELDFHPSRKLGQNFLIDTNLLSAIITDLGLESDEIVLEIGPGTGILTERLLDAGCQVVAIELDRRLCQWLRERFGGHPKFKLLAGDACTIDFVSELSSWNYRCIANLPYSITSPWLMRMIKLHERPREMGLLVQRELAERLTAKPKTKEYGALTLATALYYQAEWIRKVPPDVFFPRPEVESAYLLLRESNNGDALTEEQRQLFLGIIRAGFGHRRKNFIKLINSNFPDIAPKLKNILEQRGFTDSVRAEELNFEDFLALAASSLDVSGMGSELKGMEI